MEIIDRDTLSLNYLTLGSDLKYVNAANNTIEKAIGREKADALHAEEQYSKELAKAIELAPSHELRVAFMQSQDLIVKLREEIEPKFLGYLEAIGGEKDDLLQITHLSSVLNDGTVIGPVYNPQGQEQWLMSEAHIRNRESRLECGAPNGNSSSSHWRLRRDDEGSDSDSDFSITESWRTAHDLAVYKRDNQWYNNVRIMVDRTGIPLSVLPNWKPEEEWKTLQVPVLVESNEITHTRQAIYYDTGIKARQVVRTKDGGHATKTWTPIRIRIRNMTCGLMIHLMKTVPVDEMPLRVRVGFRECALKLNQANTYGRVHMKMETLPVFDSNGDRVIDYWLPDYDKEGKRIADKPVYAVHKKSVQYRTKGGISFKESSQLAPVQGKAYSHIPRFSVVGVNANNLIKRFHMMNDNDTLDVCQCVEYKEDTRKVKKQVYAVLPYKIRGKTMHFVVFSDCKTWRS